MKSFFEWFKEKNISPDEPWLILGKGPSFAKRNQYDLTQFHTIGLNHVCREHPVFITHAIDVEVVGQLGDALLERCQYLVMPWVPHTKNKPKLPLLPHYETRLSDRNLGQLVEEDPLLRELDRQGRLLWYNLSSSTQRRGNFPVVEVRYFSVEAALNLLAQAGVKRIRSLGIDGGTNYSKDFDDLKGVTLLANRRSSFDKQFEGMAQTILRTGVDYAPLDVASPIRVYIGATEAQMLPVKVLEYSVRKHASMSVEVLPLHLSGIDIPAPKDLRNQPRTPFTFQRFLIPALTGYRGKAIYLDSDMQVFKDIRQLWTLPFNGADLLTVQEPHNTGRRPQFSVMILNCDSLKWDINEIISDLNSRQLSYEQLVYEMVVAKNIHPVIDPVWNSLERYLEGQTALLHYTDMPAQPWISTENTLGYLWFRDLLEALEGGFISIEFVEYQVRKGNIRPSLPYQIEHHIGDSFLLPPKARLLDKNFTAPFQTIPKYISSAWLSPTKLFRAAARHYYQESSLSRLERRIRARFT